MSHETSQPPCRLYVLTPPLFDPEAFAPVLDAALDAGNVACVQLRMKTQTQEPVPDDTLRQATEYLMPITHAHDAAFLINDRPDLAREMGADGAHIGQQDMAFAEARAILGSEAILGITCHNSRHLAMEAGEKGADYVAFGAFHPTHTKATESRAGPDLLRWWSELFEIPCVAIGGITVENAPPLIEAGANFLAVSSGIWSCEKGPGEAVRALTTLMTTR